MCEKNTQTETSASTNLDVNWFEIFKKHDLDVFMPILMKFKGDGRIQELLHSLNKKTDFIIGHLTSGEQGFITEIDYEDFFSMKKQFHDFIFEEILGKATEAKNSIVVSEFIEVIESIVKETLHKKPKLLVVRFYKNKKKLEKGCLKDNGIRLNNDDIDNLSKAFPGWLINAVNNAIAKNRAYFNSTLRNAIFYNSITGGKNGWGWIKSCVEHELRKMYFGFDTIAIAETDNCNEDVNGSEQDVVISVAPKDIARILDHEYNLAKTHRLVALQKNVLREYYPDLYVSFLSFMLPKSHALNLKLQREYVDSKRNKLNYDWQIKTKAITYWLYAYVNNHAMRWVDGAAFDKNFDALLGEISSALNRAEQEDLVIDNKIEAKYLDAFLSDLPPCGSLEFGVGDMFFNKFWFKDNHIPKLMKKQMVEVFVQNLFMLFVMFSEKCTPTQLINYDKWFWVDYEEEAKLLINKDEQF